MEVILNCNMLYFKKGMEDVHIWGRLNFECYDAMKIAVSIGWKSPD